MSPVDWWFDGTLGALLLALAAGALHARQLYTGVMLFVAFGLVLALVWARLGAPDLALAEAAIGAGLTGALLMSALAATPAGDTPSPKTWRWPMVVLLLILAVPLMGALRPLPHSTPILPDLVDANLADSGVSHGVTAVLLNFRAWDTLLELLVLLLALLGVRQLRAPSSPRPEPWPLLAAWSRILAPLSVMLGGYLLWRGAFAPGGAFQAGALLAAGAVVLRLARLLPPLHWGLWPVRVSVLTGLWVFLAVGIACALFGSGWLHYPPAWSGALIVLIEAAATVSIATALTLMVVGEPEELRT